MSIDTTFHPLTETAVIDNTAAAQIKQAGQRGVTTFRIAARSAAPGTASYVYVAYGPASTVAAPSAPAAVGLLSSAGSTGVISIPVNSTVYLELPPNFFFIASTAFATSWVEVTGGIGGEGG